MHPLLKKVSTEDLLEEISRRHRVMLERDTRVAFKPCDECVNFVPFGDSGEMPDTYNPCSKGHKMKFRMPEHVTDYDYGFYRRCCIDHADRGAKHG